MEQKRLKKYVNEKENVFLLDIICFEYILLEFKELLEWIYAPEDDICGLDHNRRSVFEKMKRIYDGSSLRLQFPKVGLEVVA